MSLRNFMSGCAPSPADPRDHVRAVAKARKRPPSFDLRHLCPPVYDQGQMGSCTANAIAAAIELDFRAAQKPTWMPSRLFLYYNERRMVGMAGVDGGGHLRNGLKSLLHQGVCPEKAWPYEPQRLLRRPSARCYVEGIRTLAVSYERVQQNATALEHVLLSGKPVLFGFHVYRNFEGQRVARFGRLGLPAKGAKRLGGHAVLCVGYDRVAKRFLVRNSWGAAWGLGGYFWMPYAYVCDPELAYDFWVLEAVASKPARR